MSSLDPDPSDQPASVLSMLDRADVPWALLDASGVVLQTSVAFPGMFGRAAGELDGERLIDVLGSEHREALNDMIEHLPSTQVTMTMEVLGPDGGIRAVQLELGPWSSGPVEGGHDRRVICIGRQTSRLPGHRGSASQVNSEGSISEGSISEGSISEDPAPDSAGVSRDHIDLHLAVESATRRGIHNTTSWALIHCEIRDSDNGAFADEDTLRACIERIRGDLRPADTVTRIEPGVVAVVAGDLHDEQDAAGVAYRLLATAVEPVSAGGGSIQAAMSIGVAVASEATAPEILLDAASEAAAEAAGSGGFRLRDLRRSP